MSQQSEIQRSVCNRHESRGRVHSIWGFRYKQSAELELISKTIVEFYLTHIGLLQQNFDRSLGYDKGKIDTMLGTPCIHARAIWSLVIPDEGSRSQNLVIFVGCPLRLFSSLLIKFKQQCHSNRHRFYFSSWSNLWRVHNEVAGFGGAFQSL